MMSWSIFFLCLALLFTLGVGLILRANLIYRQSARTRAKVIGTQIVMGTTGININSDTRMEYIRVEFIDNKGTLRRVQLWEAVRVPGKSVEGEDGKVAILYDPRDPQKVWLDSFAARYTIALICMAPAVLAVVFLLVVKIMLLVQS